MKNKIDNICSKRSKRCKQTAEIFTPEWLVNDILDKLSIYGPEMWQPNRTFCDPACGNCNILIEVLKRKLKLGHDPIQAISTIYGADIMADNIKEGKSRLKAVLNDYITNNDNEKIYRILENNIVCTPLDKYKNGSLDYEWTEFKLL